MIHIVIVVLGRFLLSQERKSKHHQMCCSIEDAPDSIAAAPTYEVVNYVADSIRAEEKLIRAKFRGLPLSQVGASAIIAKADPQLWKLSLNLSLAAANTTSDIQTLPQHQV